MEEVARGEEQSRKAIFCENVDHILFLELASRSNFLRALAAFNVKASRWTRRLLWGGNMVSDELFPIKGLVAGASGATFELAAYTLETL